MSEKRKPLKGYEDHYEINEKGEVFSLDRVVINSLGRKYLYPAKKMKQLKHMTGYSVIRLSKNGNTKTCRYHRIVAENLIPNPYNKPFVNHKDGNKRNNHPSNLEWVTAKENTKHAIDSGKMDHVWSRCPKTGKFIPNKGVV